MHDLEDAVRGMKHTFYAGFKEGLKSGEARAAKRAGYVEGLSKFLSMTKNGLAESGVDTAGAVSVLVKRLQSIVAPGTAAANDDDRQGAESFRLAEKDVHSAAAVLKMTEENSANGSPERRAAEDAVKTANAGLRFAAKARTPEEIAASKSESERLGARISEMEDLLEKKGSMSQDEINGIAERHNGEKETLDRIATEAKRSSASTTSLRVDEQVPRPSVGESPSNFSPSANDAKRLPGGTSTEESAKLTKRHLRPQMVNDVTRPVRFKGTNVSVVEEVTSTSTARRAAEMQKKQRDDLEQETDDTAAALAGAKAEVSNLETMERDAKIAAERTSVDLQLKQQRLRQAESDRQSAVRANSVNTHSDEARVAAVQQLNDAEIEVEHALAEVERATVANEEKRKAAERAHRKAEDARHKAMQLERALKALREALEKAKDAWKTLNDAAEAAESAASAHASAHESFIWGGLPL